MADSKVSDLTENTAPEARDLLYHVDLSEEETDDQSKHVTFENLLAAIISYDDEIIMMDDQIITY